jgi:hypothetical protein
MKPPLNFTPSRSFRSFTISIISAAVLISVLAPKVQASSGALTNWPTGLRFGQVSIGQSETQLVSITNSTQNSISISSISSTNPAFTVPPMEMPLVLVAGQSVDVEVVFAAQSSYPLDLTVMGTGVNSPAVTASPASLSFGSVVLGTTASAPVVLTNNQPWRLTLSSLQTQGGAFSVSGPSFPLTVESGQSVTLNVTFTPQSPGMTFGNAFVLGPGVLMTFTGTGKNKNTAAGQLNVNPGSLNFGNVMVGTDGVVSATLSAVNGDVTVSSASSSSAQFALQGISFPVTIPSGQSISVNVAFTPQSSGASSGTLTLSSNATNSAAASLAGTGVMPYVAVSWNPTEDAVGYNVYRCIPSSCSYTKVNSGLTQQPSLTDNGVAPGQTYSYVATSVSSSGQESSFSNPVEVAVP